MTSSALQPRDHRCHYLVPVSVSAVVNVRRGTDAIGRQRSLLPRPFRRRHDLALTVSVTISVDQDEGARVRRRVFDRVQNGPNCAYAAMAVRVDVVGQADIQCARDIGCCDEVIEAAAKPSSASTVGRCHVRGDAAENASD
jgi:hypothetical protein